MIVTHTVFILGAGASADYGFPIGHRLAQAIDDDMGASDPTRSGAGVLRRELLAAGHQGG